MNSEELKNYFRQVLDIESAVYTNDNVMKRYKLYRESREPDKPIKKWTTEPLKPVQHHYNSFGFVRMDSGVKKSGLLSILLFIGIIGIGLTFYLILLIFSGGSFVEGAWIKLILLFTPFYVALAAALFMWNKDTEDCRKYDTKKLEEYKVQFDNFIEEKRLINEKYEIEMHQYEEKLKIYNSETQNEVNKIQDLKNRLRTNLDKLYNFNIIYPKYRNFVAVATIYEYLESGRCDKLEGPSGAYNLYEGELRANVIIDSLSKIVSDLNQIKKTQYALYECLGKTNKLLKEIDNIGLLNAYYTEAAARAASADRYIMGVVW